MQVFVKSLDCTFAVTVPVGATVADLKAAIEDVEFIPAAQIRLSCGVTEVESGLVSELVEDDEVVAVNFDIYGGMRNKWRKKRMRRLRRKRRKMRQRAR